VVVRNSPPLQLSENSRIPLASIDASPSNPRGDDLVDIEPLAQSIRRHGLLQPICVRRVGGRYELLAGHRRLAAVQQLHERKPGDDRWRWISAVVLAADDVTANQVLIAAQAQIRTWSAAAEAKVLDQLTASGMTLEEIGQVFGRTEGWVSRRRRVLADPALASHVLTGGLSVSAAEQLLVIGDVVERTKVGQRAAAEGWSESRCRRAVQGHIRRLARTLLRELEQASPQMIGPEDWRALDALHTCIQTLGLRPAEAAAA
jgi:ParB family chromosome partitioning protein